MDPSFWLERWRSGQIGFHQPGIHQLLERFWPALSLAPGSRVYVPLCGKSLDLAWLAARGHHVVGSEISPLAIADFFSSQSLRATVTVDGEFVRHRAGLYELIEGDALELTPQLLGSVQAAYDRAALIALPAPMRERYARSMAGLLPAAAPLLLISIEYPQALKDGPPFAVMPDEIRRLYARSFEVCEVDRVDLIGESPKFATAGIKKLDEVAYLLTRRNVD